MAGHEMDNASLSPDMPIGYIEQPPKGHTGVAQLRSSARLGKRACRIAADMF